MFFRDVIGQEEIKQRLIQEVSEGRIPHAQLICGPEGVGKMPLAIAYAQMCIRDRDRYSVFCPRELQSIELSAAPPLY